MPGTVLVQMENGYDFRSFCKLTLVLEIPLLVIDSFGLDVALSSLGVKTQGPEWESSFIFKSSWLLFGNVLLLLLFGNVELEELNRAPGYSIGLVVEVRVCVSCHWACPTQSAKFSNSQNL